VNRAFRRMTTSEMLAILTTGMEQVPTCALVDTYGAGQRVRWRAASKRRMVGKPLARRLAAQAAARAG